MFRLVMSAGDAVPMHLHSLLSAHTLRALFLADSLPSHILALLITHTL